MTEPREWLVMWLRDAHAMEEQAETMLTGQASRIESYPDLKDRITRHLEETKAQAERLRQCLEGMGESPSKLKDAGGKLMATGQAMGGMFAGDEVMKGSLASYAFEQMEIASYRVLIAAAEHLGEMRVAEACKANLQEEIAMAEWLASHLPGTTRDFLDRAAAGDKDAKR
ncbi:DUF892 family protein [Paracoccus sp. S-4012]|uniref:ferritin-like domain-containing protein n=1 Tax=Paracoccus sp. S-4012 TaxID=2665648 RepID=UPI0012AFF98D|nr:ferritin-like domain-containing protein [Paracoccus sp. S-4012]MRX49204.1 DUF892 family protein [Paracoccus sp. S-4012]